jgi:hypothetical protein
VIPVEPVMQFAKTPEPSRPLPATVRKVADRHRNHPNSIKAAKLLPDQRNKSSPSKNAQESKKTKKYRTAEGNRRPQAMPATRGLSGGIEGIESLARMRRLGQATTSSTPVE